MKRRITILLTALLLISGLSWAQRAEVVAYTLDGTITGGTNGYATESEITQNNITWMVTGNTTMNPWRIGGKNLDGVDRPLYSTSTIADNITKVVVTNGTANLTVNSMTLIVSASADFSNPTSTVSGTWAASSTTTFERPAEADWTNMYFKLVYNVTAGSSNQYAQFIKAELYKEDAGAGTPSINASNVNIAYDATSGEIEYTLNNPATDGSLSVSENVVWISNAVLNETESKVTFTTTVNEETTDREGVITITYTYGDNETVTKDVTVTQAAAPVIYDDIEDLFNAATSTATDVMVSFESWFVTGVSTNGKNVYVTDGTNGFVIFDNNGGLGDTYHVNDLIEGTTTASLVLYTGFAELKNVDATNLTMTSYEAPAFADVAMADLSGINTGALLHYDNLTCSVNTSGNTPKYYLSDGTTTLQVYNALYAFNTLENGKIYNITGVYQQYNNTKEILPRSADDIEEVVSTVPSITVDPDEVNVDAEEHDGTLGLTYENLTITDMEDFGIQYYDAEGEETTEPDWIEVLVAEQDPQIGEGYVVSYYMVENEGEARTAYFKVYAMDDEGELVYSNLVTVNQEAPVVPPTGDEYALYTGELVEGDYVICYNNTTWTAAMKNTVESGRLSYEEVTPDNGVVITDDATIVWHIAQSGDYWTIYSADANAYAAGTGVKNKAQMLDDGTDDLAMWTVTGTDAYDFVNKGNAAANVNAYLRNNTTYGFACYAATTGGALSLYKKVEATETYTLDITGYTANSTGGYYLIASPVNVNPANVEGMTEGTFDLYYFDQAEEDEWRNYEAQTFNLVPGKGYLYAKQATTEGEIFHFTLTGTPYSGDGMIELDYTEGGDFPGWNLVGNPYGVAAEISNDFYVMNGDGTEIIAGESEFVEPMQGVFVIAENDGDYVIFAPAVAPGSGNEKLVMNVCRERGNVIDRAIVRFGEGRQLPKFQLNANSTKLYITEGENEYAVVRSANEGEMPVSFKAAENGTYTLSVNAENMEMNYLHLIDNMTKADVDLLANPNYTFEANTTDLANRFTLVFAATGMNENTTQSFAFFNGSEWVISNMGEATLQVVDVMGRIVSSETINGNASVSLNQTSGVYMLRLVNGDNVKVQKVVVR